jgi:WD repeat-containing protein 35
VSIVVAEYIPFGANNIVQVNNNLGAGDRVQGGFFTALVDNDSSGTKFVIDPGLTSINILDYSNTRHVNFEADIHFPEDPGIIQVETFGVSMNADGTIFYGMQVEAVMDRIKDNISLDMLSRLLVDVSLDSSTIVDSVLSSYQRKLLNLIYAGDAASRDKVNLIIANEVTPHLTAEEYMDKGDYENELKQVIGDTRAAFDISEHDTLIFGGTGLLIAGPNARVHEPLLCSYLQFTGMDMFVRNFFSRMFMVNDQMRELRSIVNNYLLDPLSMNKIHDKLQVLSDDVRMMGEILGYLVESLEACEIPPQPGDSAGRALYARLQIADLAAQLSMRVLDLKKLVDGTRLELAHLRHLGKVIFDSKQLKIHEAALTTARNVASQGETQERTASSLKMIMLILSGLLAFEVLDRLTGDWTVMDSEWFKDFALPMVKRNPLIWFLINMGFWALMAFVSYKVFQLAVFGSQGVITLRIRIMQRVIMDRFHAFIASKNMSLEERIYDDRVSLVRVSWEESIEDKKRYGGTLPKVTVEYDRITCYIHTITIEYNRRLAVKGSVLTGNELRSKIADEMAEAGVFVDKSYSFRDDSIDVQPDVFNKEQKNVRNRMVAKFNKKDKATPAT